ncbi:hypothetical protein DIS24_g1356 [Lasiodiplodia hormozganensis]|uniref:Uncharacterized protein n=1 Tax=Lasiodiplodia hormozganensis TaxID=869390 RepID=A0AA40D5E3_9PEZI|nr:hypothetical protein DIS24_g1356 [Lasiodiplodia hormozganensis]
MPILPFSFSLRPRRQQRTSSISSLDTSPPPSRQSTFSTTSDSTTSSTFSTFSSSCDAEKCDRTCGRDYHYRDPVAGEEWEMGTITARKARVLLPSSLREQQAHQRRRRGSTVEKWKEGGEVGEEKEKQKEAAKVWREWWI